MEVVKEYITNEYLQAIFILLAFLVLAKFFVLCLLNI